MIPFAHQQPERGVNIKETKCFYIYCMGGNLQHNLWPAEIWSENISTSYSCLSQSYAWIHRVKWPESINQREGCSEQQWLATRREARVTSYPSKATTTPFLAPRAHDDPVVHPHLLMTAVSNNNNCVAWQGVSVYIWCWSHINILKKWKLTNLMNF